MSLEVVFLEVLNTSLLVSMIACVIMIIRVLFKRVIPKAGLYLLWSIVLIRLVVPISIPSPMSLFNAMPQTESVPSVENETFSKVTIVPSIKPSTTPETRPELEVEGGTTETIEPDVELGETEVNPPTETKQPQEPISLIAIISYVWLAGTGMLLVGLITWYTITYLRLKRAVRVSQLEALNKCKEIVGIKKDVSIYVSDLFSTPVVFGLIKPKIIVPKTLDLSESQSVMHMLTHELVHIKRFDHVTKLLSQMLLCVHWFNPFMWLSYRVYEGDMESSCDESVLRLSGDDIRGDYATSLLNLAKQQQDHTMRSSFVAFGESDLKKRVKGIMGYKSRTIFSIVTAILIIGLVGCSLLTNPVGIVEEVGVHDLVAKLKTTNFEKNILEFNENLPMNMIVDSYDQKIELVEAKIVEDEYGSGRKGIVVEWSFTNDSTERSELNLSPIESNEYVFDYHYTGAGDIQPYDITEEALIEEYVEDAYVHYRDDSMQGCKEIDKLDVGESINCYTVSSYAGDDKYYTIINAYQGPTVSILDLSSEDSDVVSLEGKDKVDVLALGKDSLEISFAGYEIVPDPLDPDKEGISIFFNRKNVGDYDLFTENMTDAYYNGGLVTDLHLSYDGKRLQEMSYGVPEDQEVYPPEYKNLYACAWDTSLAPGESEVCYLFYPYQGEGEYIIEEDIRLSGEGGSYLSINVPNDPKVDDFYTEKYSLEEGILSNDYSDRSEYETMPYLSTDETTTIFKNGVEIGTLGYEGHDVFQHRSGRKGLTIFYNQTNTGTTTLHYGLGLFGDTIGINVFHEDISLTPMWSFPPYGTRLKSPEYEGIGLCSEVTNLQPGETITCYEYYSYVDSGEYLISVGSEIGETPYDFGGYKSYLIEVE